jgi:starch synthase
VSEAPPVLAPASDGGRRPLSVLMVASEVLPFAKTGGLADVAAALPAALAGLGHQVVVAMPRYRGVPASGEVVATFVMDVGPEHLHVQILRERLANGAQVWLVDIPALFDREGLYGVGSHDHPDNPRRFAALARAAFETAILTGFAPDVVHAHDWQGGLAPVYLRTRYATHPVLGGVPSVFTIHNIAYPGLCDAGWMPALDLDWDLYTPQALEYWGQVSLLKAGINFSEKVTTVSRRYAEEILTPEFAYGMEGVLAARRADLVGILNGIDADVWNPATDRFLPVPYAADMLEGKRASKRAVLEAYGLPADDEALKRPLIGMVSRMVAQKGLDIISSVAGELPHLGARFVVLGTGEPAYEAMWRRLAAQFPDRIGVRVGFDEGLSHLIEAGSDLFLMPSRFEPCGLNQMYSLRYGTLPLVRATGGLDDTVENYDPYTGRGTGFKFWEASGPSLIGTLRWALRVYDHPDVWQRLQRAGMAGDFSWTRSAQAYVEVYDAALARTGRRRAAST